MAKFKVREIATNQVQKFKATSISIDSRVRIPWISVKDDVVTLTCFDPFTVNSYKDSTFDFSIEPMPVPTCTCPECKPEGQDATFAVLPPMWIPDEEGE